MATAKTKKPTSTVVKVLAYLGIAALAGGAAFWAWNKVNKFKALADGIRAQVGDVDLSKMISLTPKLPVRIDIDNNSNQPIKVDNIIATVYKIDANGIPSQLATNTPTGNIEVPAQQRTPVLLNITIPAVSILTTVGSGLLNEGKEKYRLESSVVVMNKTTKLDPIEFSV